MALGKIKSKNIKDYIYELSKDKELQGNWIIQKAIEYYEDTN